MDNGDIHDTARQMFLAKITNGDMPQTLVGGQLDGLRYFVLKLDGRTYWITDRGLFDPPDRPLADE